MKIGEVARLAGVNVQTLRYYERRGLIPEPTRSAGNYRVYPDVTVTRVRFIKRAQSLGFELEEVRDLLQLHDAPNRAPLKVRALAKSKLENIEQKMAELSRMRDVLRQLITECKQRKRNRCCPILDALQDEADLIL